MSSKWAKRRKTIYGLGVLLFLSAIIVPVIIVVVHEPPSCHDGKMNQGETNIDRGGPCRLLDETRLQTISVLWSRAFPVRDGVYSAVAYIENPNPKAGMMSVKYRFKLYNEQNILIASRIGMVPVPPGRVFPIFESGLNTGNRTASKVFFEFLSSGAWIKMEDPTDPILIYDETVSGVDKMPRVDAKVKNTDVKDKRNVVFIATIFDESSNAFATSRTFVDKISAGEEMQIAFTWPKSFSLTPARVDIAAMMLPEL